MGIKRYIATADNTITNAFQSDLQTRGTGSNMGAADVLEAFYIYGQVSLGTASYGNTAEKSRILVQFDINKINEDRTSGLIPASGNVSWYFNMYNAPHTFTLPKDFKMIVKVASGSWQEGYGLDMNNYTNQTYQGTGSNWIYKGASGDGYSTWLTEGGDFAESDLSPAYTSSFVDGTEDLSIDISNIVEDWLTGGNSAISNGQVNVGANSANTDDLTFKLVDSQGTVVVFRFDKDVTTAGEVIGTSGLGSVAAITDKIIESINNVSQLRITAADRDDLGTNFFGLTMDDIGLAGNKLGGPGDFEDSGSLDSGTQWITANTGEFVSGTGIPNYGLGVFMSSSFETGSHSYYTKKFFARSSEYFFLRPNLEARWDSSTKDDAGKFMLSSSILTVSDNANTLYLYNYVNGELKDIGNLHGTTTSVRIFSGSLDNTQPTGSALKLPVGPDVATDGNTKAIGGPVDVGIYTASVAFNSSSIDTIFPVWLGRDGTTQIHTGSAITVNTHNMHNYNPVLNYVTSIDNLKVAYSRDEEARFRLFVRAKDWDPNNYTVVQSEPVSEIVEDAYFSLYRTVDDYEVIPYGTGSAISPQATASAGSYTRLSYDISGNYFDLDMSLLQSGYEYGLKFAYYSNGSYREQKEVFKFKVEE